MSKIIFLSTLTLLGIMMNGLSVSAQTAQGQTAPPPTGQLLNAPYLTPTGETVPHPGLSQSGGPTQLDRKIQNEDDAIDKSLCNNCGQ